jgi:SAM-dependent methyltransferase
MIETARRRAEGLDFPGSFRQGDSHHLPFADGAFDGCRAERVLIHSDDPAQALANMSRVTQPGGRVVVIEPDLETVILHLSDHALARKLTALQYDCVRNGHVGRQLPGLFQQCGLTNIQLLPTVHPWRARKPPAHLWGGSAARFACCPLRGPVFDGNRQTPHQIQAPWW